MLPGFDGGGEWGGAAVDTRRGVMYVNASDVPWIAAMREAAVVPEDSGPPRAGSAIYVAACATCHGADRPKGPRPGARISLCPRAFWLAPHRLTDRGSHSSCDDALNNIATRELHFCSEKILNHEDTKSRRGSRRLEALRVFVASWLRLRFLTPCWVISPL